MSVILFSSGLGNTQTAWAENINCLNVDPVYSWLTQMQQPNGLLLTCEEGKNVSLYDNALAALVFTHYGDFKRAEKIFGFFNSRLHSEMMVNPGGFAQMRTIDGVPVDNMPRRWMGDNAWLLIAINNYHHLAKNTKYHELASALSSWIISLQDTDGGLWGGYDATGNRISKIAEGNLDAFNAIEGYTRFHKKLLAYFKNKRWDATDQLLVAWAEYPAYKYALDLHSWGYCIFEDFPETVLTKAERYLTTQTSTATKEKITGYCFDEDKDVVWLEGTGQMAVAFIKAGKQTEAEKYLSEMKKNLVKSQLYPGTCALPYTVNYGSSYADDVLWNGVDSTPAVASTAWYLFASRGFDPLKLGYRKNIPKSHQFWKTMN
ncbi:MAG TPA: hypothetical protein VFG54_08435 [Prolixibacteraceae bacterium]|nr:hypothetical protein [Prolixibacteraceae bacterium]